MGISVPMIGMTLDTLPVCKALNIKYAPEVQRRVDADARMKVFRDGWSANGISARAMSETMLK